MYTFTVHASPCGIVMIVSQVEVNAFVALNHVGVTVSVAVPLLCLASPTSEMALHLTAAVIPTTATIRMRNMLV